MSSKYSPTIIYERRLNKNNQNNLTNKQNSKLRKSQPQEDVKENNSITIITNKYYLDTNEIANLKNNQNPKCHTTNNIKQAKNKSTNQKNNKFLSTTFKACLKHFNTRILGSIYVSSKALSKFLSKKSEFS